MIDNIYKAIIHAREVAKNWRSQLVNCVSEEGRCKIQERASEHELIADWLEELAKRRATEPIVYEITENSQGFTVETNDDRNIGLKKVSTSNLIYAMREITEKYWDEGLRVVFKYYCGNGDEWQKCYESEDK